MSTSAAATLEWLFRPLSREPGIDREALAGLLVELARNVEPQFGAEPNGVRPIDPRLEQLRNLLVGREIEVLSRLRKVLEDPEQLAIAVGRVLPAAVAQVSSDARLGEVLAPTLEKATQSSIRSDPRTLLNILYPLIVPAIRKSIGETIDETFQSLNESLKHSLTWRGLKWRWEAWRTGVSFAEVVLKHTLVYQVEHVFLIHRHTGLLISHVAAANAVGQDPQLVSSMLVAIQDFVRDSFSGADQQGLDTARLGDLLLWSEPGPFAMLVAVIRGNPPEGLHETLRDVLSRIHDERRHALESFDGDSSGFADLEANLRECVALGQRAQISAKRGFPWFVALVGLVLLALGGLGGWRWWQNEQAWEHAQQLEAGKRRTWDGYVAQLRAEPGIVITEAEQRDGKFVISGLRDPLAIDPQLLLHQAGIDPTSVASLWKSYQGLEPTFVLVRLQRSLDPPPSVTLEVEGDRIVARGSAASTWIDRARVAGRRLPAGGPSLDLSHVHDINEGAIGKLSEAIQSHEIHFNFNQSLPTVGQDAILDQLAKELTDLESLASRLRLTARVMLTGHSDDAGNGTFNLSLSLARAEAVRALLKKRGVDPDLLAVRGAGQLEPLETASSEAARSANRRVSFKVGIEEQQ
ncbi:MAG TPA: OmpA family protein [Myxococcaceae bacterium]|nr:OmpA family protein [Myxococcaceae bacterium]